MKEELRFVMGKAKQDIVSWKAHLLRSVNQEEARLDIINALDDTSVLLVQDWAMKFLPRKFRGSQTDWFAKRGISWHLTVAIRRGNDHKIQMMTFVNVFRSCSQDSCTVLSVMSEVVRQLREGHPQLQNIYYWQDNAGCYHCGTTIVGAKLIGQQHGVSVRRMDFCDSQAGKGVCDRRAATIKSHMKIFLNSGNNMESAEEMKNAILSSGGVPSVNVTISGPPEASTFSTVRLEGVSTISNIEYSEEGLRVWKAYKIGPGKLIQWEKLDVQPNAEIPRLSAIDCDTCGENAQFKTVTSKKARFLQNKRVQLALAIHQVVTNPPQMNRMLVSFPVLKKGALNVINGSPHFKGTWTVADITLLLRTRVSSTEPLLVIPRDWMCSPVVCQIFRQKYLKCDQWKTRCSPWAGH